MKSLIVLYFLSAVAMSAMADIQYTDFASRDLPKEIRSKLASLVSLQSAEAMAPFLRPTALSSSYHSEISQAGSKIDKRLPTVMERVAERMPGHATHIAASNDNTTISGRRVTFADGSVAFDQQQLWFNVSFSGPAALYVTFEVMCLQGGQTPNIFRAFSSDGADPPGVYQEIIYDTVSLQQSNGTNPSQGPYCGVPITLPMAFTSTSIRPSNFSLFKDTEPNYNNLGENWVVLYGFSLVGASPTTTISKKQSSPVIPRLRANKRQPEIESLPAFHPAPFSLTHLRSYVAAGAKDPVKHAKGIHRQGLVFDKATDVPRRRRIEWLGDSVTVGYATLCHLQNVTNVGYTTESGWFSWPNPTCAFFGAECHVQGWSGKGLIRNCNGTPPPAMDEYYLRTISTSTNNDWAWNFSSWVPDAVVMRLGTNDFSNTDDGPAFMKNYTDAVVKFFSDTFSHYGPQVQIFVACGPSRTDYCQGLSDAMSIVRQPDFAIKAAATNTHFIDLREIYNSDNSNVCAGHPDTNAAYVLATRAIGAIASVMNWNEWDV